MPGRRALSVLVVVGLLAATAAAAFLAYETERDRVEAENQALARQAALLVRKDIEVIATAMEGADSLVGQGGSIDERRLRAFAREALSRTPFRFLAWAALVDPGERGRWERENGTPVIELRQEGGFRPLRDDPDRELLPVTLLHPPDRNLALRGFDLLSSQERAPTVRRALRRDQAQMTGPTPLARSGEAGTVVYGPVNAIGSEAPAGVLAAGISGDAVVAALRRQLQHDGRLAVQDAGAQLAGDVDEDGETASLNVLGRRWDLTVSGAASMNLNAVIARGVTGLALALAATILFWSAGRRERELVGRRSEAEQRGARESLLVRIGEAIEREIEGDARLGSLARELVPAVGDICVVHEVTPAGAVRRVGVAAPDERITEVIRAMPEPSAPSPIRAAISSREPVLYTRIADDRERQRSRERGIPDPEGPMPTALEELQADEISNMIVPLIAHDKALGTLSLSILESSGRPPLTREDLAFAMEVAAHAAVALDNARLYEQQRDIATILQGALVPRALPDIAGAEVAARHRAGMIGSEVGGDFYDLFEVAGRWMAVVGDVCGKGPEAAALTALARHTVRATARLGPAGAVGRVHEAIKSSGERTYCTLCCAELAVNGGGIDVRMTTAGHPEPRVIATDGSVRRLDVTGPLVGALDNPSFGDQALRLSSGEVLFMCSDGVPEARRRGEVFGDHRLEALLSALAGASPEELLERVETEVLKFVENRPRDDIAIFALRVT